MKPSLLDTIMRHPEVEKYENYIHYFHSLDPLEISRSLLNGAGVGTMQQAHDILSSLSYQFEFRPNGPSTWRNSYGQTIRKMLLSWSGESAVWARSAAEKYECWLGSMGTSARFMCDAIKQGAIAYHEACISAVPVLHLENNRTELKLLNDNNHLRINILRIAFLQDQYALWRTHNIEVMMIYFEKLRRIELHYLDRAVWWDLMSII